MCVHESESFILQKDIKYNDGDIKTLYCLAIPRQRNLKSIRDLTGKHLHLLKTIREESLGAIETKLKVKRSKILSFFHYQPTFYHLHVHFTHCEYTGQDRRDCVKLDDVINNIEMVPDYYQRATLTYKMGTQMPLFNILADFGILENENHQETKINEVKIKQNKIKKTKVEEKKKGKKQNTKKRVRQVENEVMLQNQISVEHKEQKVAKKAKVQNNTV